MSFLPVPRFGRARAVNILLTACLLAVAVLSTLLSSGCSSGKSPKVGTLAPSFSVIDVNGNKVSLEDLKGWVVVLNFWASWCGPCRDEMPLLQSISREYASRDVVVLGINVEEGKNSVASYARQLDLSFRVATDPDGQATQSYYVRALPTTFFLDRNGVIRAKETGAMSRQTIVDDLAEAMSIQ